MKKTVLFLFPFGKNLGVGHLVRQAVIGKALREAGYETVLWSDGQLTDIPSSFKAELELGFDRIMPPSAIIDDSKLPSAAAVKDLDKMDSLAAVIIDDYRKVGDPRRLEMLKALRALTKARSATVNMVDGVVGLEFDEVDRIINIELGLDEKLYKPQWKSKMIHDIKNTLLRPAFFKSEPIPDKIPENPFAVMIGGADPMNCALPILQGMVGQGYNPILVSPKSAKPEDAARIGSLEKALSVFPQSLWLHSLSAGQMRTLWDTVKFAIVGGPGASFFGELFYTRCPFIGVFSNRSLEENVKAIERMGIPALRAQNHDALMQAVWAQGQPVSAQFVKGDLVRAVRLLESLGTIKNRLPNTPPFNEVDEHGAERALAALGLGAGILEGCR